jgi:flagellar hook-associated protein 2
VASGITFSAFNNIDFSVVVNALMAQASMPLTALQSQQFVAKSKVTTYDTLSSSLSTLQTSVDALSNDDGIDALAVSSSDSSTVAVSSNGSGVAGHYNVVVEHLAKAQVTASTSTATSLTSIVATGGTLTIGTGTTIDVDQTGPLTLQQLADAINADDTSPASAAIVQTNKDEYRLVLTAKSTGLANAFTIADGLTGPGAVTFGANAVGADDASVLVNNVRIKNATNVIESGIPGATVTLLRENDQAPVAVDVTRDTGALKAKINNFISTYNSLVKFAGDQATAAANGDNASIARDPLLRGLRNALRTALTSSYAGTGSATAYASQAGIEFTRTGTLQFNQTAFDAAVKNGTADVKKLFAGGGGTSGLFASLDDLLTGYTQTAGLVDSAQQQLTKQLSRLDDQIAKMQDRLALERAALQQQFTAADAAMKALNNQTSALSSVGQSISS